MKSDLRLKENQRWEVHWGWGGRRENRAVLASMRCLTPIRVLQTIRTTSPAACCSFGVTPTCSFLSERRHSLCTTHAPFPLRPTGPGHQLWSSWKDSSSVQSWLLSWAPSPSAPAVSGQHSGFLHELVPCPVVMETPPPPWSRDRRAFLATSARPGE